MSPWSPFLIKNAKVQNAPNSPTIPIFKTLSNVPYPPREERKWEPLRGTPGGKKIPAYLGIDVGSISTNVVVTDENIKVLSKRYLITAFRPIEAIRQGLKEVSEEVGPLVEIKGVCTAGSGRPGRTPARRSLQASPPTPETPA
jgi:activator of 2-hydroxyglutaryl-CoA dehydratase